MKMHQKMQEQAGQKRGQEVVFFENGMFFYL
jgi:hypothetical protein